MRPTSISEVASLAKSGERPFDLALREFLDAWQSIPGARKSAALAEEPARIAPIHDAYLAATAEYLASVAGMDAPEWTDAPERFLHEPFFAGGLESLKATLLVESPAAFRRRLIFVSANALSRPRREFIRDNAPTVTNLDV
jgi:hypothetical protein